MPLSLQCNMDMDSNAAAAAAGAPVSMDAASDLPQPPSSSSSSSLLLSPLASLSQQMQKMGRAGEINPSDADKENATKFSFKVIQPAADGLLKAAPAAATATIDASQPPTNILTPHQPQQQLQQPMQFQSIAQPIIQPIVLPQPILPFVMHHSSRSGLQQPQHDSTSNSSSSSSHHSPSSSTLLTSNANLSTSFRKDNGKRCLLGAPLQDGQLASQAGSSDYPNLFTNPNESSTSASSAFAFSASASSYCAPLFPHAPLAPMEHSAASSVGGFLDGSSSGLFGPPSIRPSRSSGGSLGLNTQRALSSLHLPLHPVMSTPSPAPSSSSSSFRMTPLDNLLGGVSSLSAPRTPTPSSSPARQQLSFDSGDKKSSTGGFGSTSTSTTPSAPSSAETPLRMALIPLSPSLDSPVTVQARASNGSSSSQNNRNSLGLRGTPNRRVTTPGSSAGGGGGRHYMSAARQAQVLASPALTIDATESRHKFQIRNLCGLIQPPSHHPPSSSSAAEPAAGAGGDAHKNNVAVMIAPSKKFVDESKLEEEEMAANRRQMIAQAVAASLEANAAAAAAGSGSGSSNTAAAADAAAAVASSSSSSSTSASNSAGMGHRPKRARSIAASLFSSVAGDLPLSRSGSIENQQQQQQQQQGAVSSATGISPLLASSTLQAYSGSALTGRHSVPPQQQQGAQGAHVAQQQKAHHQPQVRTFSSMRTYSSPPDCSPLPAGSFPSSASFTSFSSLGPSSGTSSSTSGPVSGPRALADEQPHSAPYAQQLALSSALAEDSLLRTLMASGAGAGASRPSSTSPTSLESLSAAQDAAQDAAAMAMSASASPRYFASASPPPQIGEALSWGSDSASAAGVAAAAASGAKVAVPSSSSSSTMMSRVNVMDFIPASLEIDDGEEDGDLVRGGGGLASAPVHSSSSCSGHLGFPSVVAATAYSADTLAIQQQQYRRGSTSMLDSVQLLGCGGANSSAASAVSLLPPAQQAAVLMDESEDDAAECASTSDAFAAAAGFPSSSFNFTYSNGDDSSSSTGSQGSQQQSVDGGGGGGGGVLPSIGNGGTSCDVKRISSDTMSRLLSGEFHGPADNQLDNFIVIDCRYDYEYSGGHIDGAINLNDRALLSKFFRVNSGLGSRLAVVFHCEFSQNRAPKSYKFFRSLDRLRNAANYPSLSFPEIAVLEGGYKSFFADYPQHCEPRNYVSMWDDAFQLQCKEQTSKHRKSWGTGKVAAASALAAAAANPNSAAALAAAAAQRALRHRSQTQGAFPSLPLVRAASALVPSPSSSSSSSMSLFPPSSSHRESLLASPSSPSSSSFSRSLTMGALMFSPAPASSNGASASAAASSAGMASPFPSFSLLSAGSSPSDGSAHGAAAAASASSLGHHTLATPLPAINGSSSNPSIISPLAPLTFNMSLHGEEESPSKME